MSYLFPLVAILCFANLYAVKHLLRSSRISIDQSLSINGVLTVNKMYSYAGKILIVLGFLFLVISIYKQGINVKSVIFSLSFALSASMFGVFIILYVNNHKVILGEDNITIKSAFNNEKLVKWEDMISIKPNYLLSMYSIKTTSKKHLINQHLVGINLLLERAKGKGIKVKDLPN